MHPLHVVASVPAAWEAITLLGSFTVLEKANIGVVSMVMHPVGFPFMTEKASIG